MPTTATDNVPPTRVELRAALEQLVDYLHAESGATADGHVCLAIAVVQRWLDADGC